MPPSVHFIAHHDEENAVSRYRCLNLIEELKAGGADAKFSFRYSGKPIEVVEDVVVLNRLLFDSSIKRFIADLRAAGKAVVFGVDDLIFGDSWAEKDKAEGNEHWHETLGFQRASRQTLDHSDCALVSTEFLAEEARTAGKAAFVLRNVLPTAVWDASVKVQRTSNEKVVLGYFSGTSSHNRDFASIAEPLARVLRENPNVQLLLVGPLQVDPALQEFQPRITRKGAVGWRDLPALLAQADVNLAPLDLSFKFNFGKSHLKWLESAAVKVPTVASRTQELQGSVQEGLDGFTASTSDEWYAAISRLAKDKALRQKIGEAAFEKVQRAYLPAEQVGATLHVFEAIAADFCTRHGERVLFRQPNLAQKVMRKFFG